MVHQGPKDVRYTGQDAGNIGQFHPKPNRQSCKEWLYTGILPRPADLWPASLHCVLKERANVNTLLAVPVTQLNALEALLLRQLQEAGYTAWGMLRGNNTVVLIVTLPNQAELLWWDDGDRWAWAAYDAAGDYAGDGREPATDVLAVTARMMATLTAERAAAE